MDRYMSLPTLEDALGITDKEDPQVHIPKRKSANPMEWELDDSEVWCR